jgi:cyclic-di-AMP phosphodiesterase PgpH
MTVRELIGLLSRPPQQRWPDAVVHHGARLLLLLGLAGATSMLFPVAPVPDFPVLERGVVAQEDVIAEIGFPIFRSEQELARARADAAAVEKPVFVYDSTAVDTMLGMVDQFFARVESALTEGGTDAGARRALRELLSAYAVPPSSQDVDILMDRRERDRLRRTVRDAILDELPRGVALPAELEEAGSQEIRLIAHGRDRTVERDSILTSRDFYNRARWRVPATAPPGYEQLQHLLLVRFLVPSIHADWTATEQARARARAAVPVVKYEVLPGERIVAAREQVRDEQLERLRAYQQALERRGELGGDGRRRLRTVGAVLYNLLALSLFGALLYFYRPEVYGDIRHATLLSTLALSVVATAAVVANYEAPVALVPIAFPALVVAALWDGRLAVNLSLILAILLTGQTPFLGMTALLTLVTAGAVASLSVRVVRRRAQTWSFIVLIAAGYAFAALILGLLREWPLAEMLTATGWGGVSAIASAFAAMGFLPLFESYTRITTDQTLLELADANRPLLRRLAREAPGTYAHSINVANLSEAAAGAIGANALLTRVGVYYHDVGKMERPHYFIENQPGGRNPHDKLKPATSAAVVRGHVVDGLRLADEEKLPGSVKAFIAEHHGTQAISFFYEQARQAEPEADLDPRAYTYPGPKPQSKETAIVMLADSVESASRVLPDPNLDNIRDLVDRIVQGKIDAEQLDEAPLTMGELKVVKEALVNVLAGMYHQRLDYPPTRKPGPGERGGNGVEPGAVRSAAEAQAGAGARG